MYSLDINLLNERAGFQTGKESSFSDGSTISGATDKYGKAPLYIGASIAALSLLAIGGGWLWTGQQTAQLEVKQKDLDSKLGNLKTQESRLQQVTTQVEQVTGESKSLASVFDRVQPLSAVLQDLRESTPQGIAIDSIVQGESKPEVPAAATSATTPPSNGGLISKISTPPNPEAKPSPSTTPSGSPTAATTPPAGTTAATAPTPATTTLPADVPTTKLVISGKAKSFDDVNNFILTLKQSAFFNPDDIQLNSAKLTAPTEMKKFGGDPNTKLLLPSLVGYQITTSLKRVPSADLLRELERKGAVGLVTRLKTLKQQQSVKP
jgi:type IV pilus assembly protein PilN